MKYLLSFPFFFLSFITFGWDGYDWDSGSFVEIEKGNLVRSGETIEVYDYGSGQYSDYEVQSINSYGSGTEIEVYDWDSGSYRTFDMD